jgi:hypothetical protein
MQDASWIGMGPLWMDEPIECATCGSDYVDPRYTVDAGWYECYFCSVMCWAKWMKE